MNKKIIIILSILLFATMLFFVFIFFNRQPERIILFSELKRAEGVIEKVRNNELVLKTRKIELNLETMQENEVEETFEFVPHKKIRCEEYSEEIKTEEDYREEENSYLVWYNKANEEKNVFDFSFPPSWNKYIEISWQDLKEGDSLVVAYYSEESKNIAIRIQKTKDEEPNNSVVEDIKRQISFAAEISDIFDDMIKVKLVTAVDKNYFEGTILDLSVNKETVIKSATQKSEEAFRTEEEKIKKERERIKEEGGDILSLVAASWYTEKNISLKDLDKNKVIDVKATLIGEKFVANSIQQIIE